MDANTFAIVSTFKVREADNGRAYIASDEYACELSLKELMRAIYKRVDWKASAQDELILLKKTYRVLVELQEIKRYAENDGGINYWPEKNKVHPVL